MKAKVRFLSYDRKEIQWLIWKTKEDALKGKRDEYYDKGMFGDICKIDDYIGFTPSKTKITKITFTVLKGGK